MKTLLRSAPINSSLSERLKEVSRYAEVKRLVDNIMILQRQKRFQSLAVLSFCPGEGKTLFCSLMALAYTEATPSRVLLVDTMTTQNPRSLILRQCLPGSHAELDYMSMEDYRRGSNGNGYHGQARSESMEPPTMQPDLVTEVPVAVRVQGNSDQTLIRRMAEERGGHYGLILLDTAPLQVKNKNNVDPMLVARWADAAVLIVSPQVLNTPQLDKRLQTLKESAIRLIGVVSNEEIKL